MAPTYPKLIEEGVHGITVVTDTAVNSELQGYPPPPPKL